MIQNTLKILTLGFFISMITGFVMYRSGYFDSEKTSYSLHTSPNGSELSAQIDQDTTKSPEINQSNQTNEAPIMPSSKSITPAFDMEKYEKEKKKEQFMRSTKSMTYPIEIKLPEDTKLLLPKAKLENPYMYSSKSMTFPIDVKLTANQIENEKREAFRKQPELERTDSSSVKTSNSKQKTEIAIKGAKRKATTVTKSISINWRAIWIGVLGILFVAIGSIVYFKRRSK